MSLRQRLHEGSLIAFAVVATYLTWVLLAGRLGLWLSEVLNPGTRAAWRLASAFLVLDLSKLVLLLPAGLLLLRLTRVSSWALTLALVLGSYGLELGLGLLLGQGVWLLAGSAVLLARLAGAVAIAGLLLIALRRSRSLKNG